MTIALLPLGIVALLAALQTNRIADSERRADLRVSVGEATRKLGTELAADVTTLKAATAAAGSADTVALACGRLALTLSARIGSRPAYALFAPDRSIACATPGYTPRQPVPQLVAAAPRLTFGPDDLTIEISDPNGRGSAVAHYPASAVAEIVRPLGIGDHRTVVLTDGQSELMLAQEDGSSLLASTDTALAPIGLFDLSLRATSHRDPFSLTEALQAFLPLLMWASAAFVAFLIVDRLLIRPLAQVRAAVVTLQQGEPLRLPGLRTPAREIGALAEALETASALRVGHEAQIAAALADQVRLTREVHHRVKNNLQVIASLISLHARDVPPGPVAEAYAAIQRRVDALSIVHRNHFAELESTDGVRANALLKELATNLRTSMAGSGPAPAIVVDAADVRITQDVAVSIAFLVTELCEVSMMNDRSGTITLVLGEATETTTILSIQSPGFVAMPDNSGSGLGSYARIIEGLARQLRSTLDVDSAAGRYRIVIPLRAPD